MMIVAEDSPLLARLIEPDDRHWSRLLKIVPHDVYHLPGYVAASARPDGGSPAALHVFEGTRQLLIPLVVREIPGGARDATSPYGYPGPISTHPHDSTFTSRAIAAGVAELAAKGHVSLLVRLHPLLGIDGLERCGSVVEHGNTVVIDLSLDHQELWRQTSRNHRQDIQRAVREGFVFEMTGGDAAFEEFKRLYGMTIRSRGAAPYYRFDDLYFESLRKALGTHLRLAVVRIGGRASAAGLVTTCSGIVQIHLAGWDQELARFRPMKLLIHGVRTWARDAGEQALYLGGGLGARSDGLLRFKTGFSPTLVPFRTLRIIVNEGRYHRLSEALDVSDQEDPAGFFPAYRAAPSATTHRSPGSDAERSGASDRASITRPRDPPHGR